MKHYANNQKKFNEIIKKSKKNEVIIFDEANKFQSMSDEQKEKLAKDLKKAFKKIGKRI